MKNQNYTKTGLLHLFSSRHFTCHLSFMAEPPTKSRPLRFGKIEKMVTVLVILGILLVSAFGFMMESGETKPPDQTVKNELTATPSDTASPDPTQTNAPPNDNKIESFIEKINPNPPPQQDSRGAFEKYSVMNDTAWHQVAVNAWNYFQPGRGIDSTSGLPASSWGYNQFTDWDLGVYIQAVMDAEKLGLTSPSASWGSSIRLEKVMRFLETRPLLTDIDTTPPYWFYSSDGVGAKEQSRFDVVDTGTLFVSLHNLKMYNSSLASRIDNFVYNNVVGQEGNRTDYESIIPALKSEGQTSTSIYGYYMTEGFAKFFPELNSYADKVLDNILTAPTTKTPENVPLPKATLSCEPLLYSFFYLDNNPKLTSILDKVYVAHEARYESTGQYVAFSEGHNRANDDFIYEWVVLPNGDTWKITGLGSSAYLENIDPVIYTRVAAGFLSIYNSSYAKDTCIYLEKAMLSPENGYFDGAINKPNAYVNHIGCNTNGLILAAARYATR